MIERRNVWSTRRAWALILGFLVAFVVTTLSIHRLVPWPEEFGLRAKFEYYRDHKDEFDAIYVGSSRLFRGLEPAIVDAEMAQRGHPIRSFNLGFGGMTTFEQDFVLRQTVGLKSSKLRWIFFEGGPWDPADYFLSNKFTSRSIFWHDNYGTLQALHSVVLAKKPPLEKWLIAYTHLQLWAMKTNNMGQGKAVVSSLLGITNDSALRGLSDETVAEGLGYQALEDVPSADPDAAHKALMERRSDFESRIARIPAWNAQELDVESYNFDALRAQYQLAREANATLVYILPPNHEGNSDRLRLHERGDIPILFDYSDPAKYPEFFQIEKRFDQMHLNKDGALLFSRQFAADFAEQWKKAQ